jgi:pseudaminic acid cytidylyltransferase
MIAVIPARGGSTRLKNKNIRLLGGKPLIRWVTESVIDSKCFDRVIISTDSDDIYNAVNDLKVERHNRPKDHATTRATVLNAMVDLVENHITDKFDTFAYFLPTCPFIRPEQIREGVEKIKTGMYDSVVSTSYYEEPIQLACIRSKEGVIYPMFDNLTAGLTNSKFIQKYVKPNGGFYMTSRDNLLEQRNFFKGNIYGVLIPNEDIVDIDYEEDLIAAESRLQYRLS